MGALSKLGFRGGKPDDWSVWWLVVWGVTTPIWIALAFLLDVTWRNWWIWVASVALLFGVPEYFGVRKVKDPLPPLTHTIRHYLPNWLAFPLIYGLVGAVGGRWLSVGSPRYWGIAVMFAVLGWLTDHFTVTFARPDPHPLEAVVAVAVEEALAEEALEEALAPPASIPSDGRISLPPIQNPRPF